MTYLHDNGFDIIRVFVSERAHVITSESVAEDRAKYKEQQGSTGKGIAPTARDKFARTGITLKQYIKENPDNPLVVKYRENVFKVYRKFHHFTEMYSARVLRGFGWILIWVITLM